MTFDKLAEEFYKTYCASSDNKNFRGDQCPEWAALPAEIRKHWGAVADRCVRLSVGGYLRDVI